MKPRAATKKPIRRTRKRRAPSKPVVRKPAQQGPRHRKLSKFILPLLFIAFATLYGIWLSIDRRVIARLSSMQTSRLPVIYSTPFDISGFISRIKESSIRPGPIVRDELINRRYTETAAASLRPGEFTLTDRELRLFIRSYTNHSGSSVPAKKASIPLAGSESNQQPIWLEPQVISYIGSADMRASSYLSLSAIPESVRYAVLSIEDERFYKHFGLDIISILRATVRNLLALRLAEGGSTLTQQLAKNIFLSPKKTLWRKLKEIPTALSLERHLSKDQLLELYLNEVYLGQEGAVAIHGMPEAASSFFGKKLEDLKVDEAAVLAGIIKAPSYYNPRRFPDRALERRDTVLHKMHELGRLTKSELNLALSKPIKTVAPQEHRRLAPFYVAALESELGQGIDLDNVLGTEIAVYTGFDLALQKCAEKAVESGLATIEKSHPNLTKDGKRLEASLLALEPYSGLVKAWIGGRDFSVSQFNRVTQANRQAGSTVKPFLYLTALDSSLNSYKAATTISILEDKPMEIKTKGQKTWIPENYDREFRGDVTLRFALENSLNMASLYLADKVGIASLRQTLTKFNLAQDIQPLPSLALGALDTNLLRLTTAYGALANGGVYVAPRMFISALDGDNDRLSSTKLVEKRVADENATYVLTNILHGVIDRGTGKAARASGFKRSAAGKTGTSDQARDAWFVGFTPNLAAGVWVGFDDNTPLNLTGGATAAPIWGDFMSCSASYLAHSGFIAPRGILEARIDRSSGGLAGPNCPADAIAPEIFVSGTEPLQACHLHNPGSTRADGIPSQSGFWSSLFE